MTSSSESVERTVQGSDERTQQNSVNSDRKSAEDPNVTKIRAFFDSRTKHLKADKLSQAYLAMKFTEGDVRELKELTDDATAHKLSLDNLQSMFQAYCQDPQFSPNPDFPKEWRKPEEWKNWQHTKPANILHPWVLKNFLLKASILTAIGTGIWGIVPLLSNLRSAERGKYFQAWQVITSAQGQPGMAGRNEALKYLNTEEWMWWLYTPECKKPNNNNCLVGIKIEKANLQGVNLDGANLTSSEFRETSFRDANLKSTTFDQSHLEGARFKRANLQGSKFESANLEGAVFKGANLTGALFTKANLINADFTNDESQEGDASQANLTQAKFESVNLKGAIFKGANLQGTVFNKANLTDADFTNTDAKPENFKDSKFCRTKMSNGKLYSGKDGIGCKS
jgi:uncharacterized protein YjbI with pentapeptide repeats